MYFAENKLGRVLQHTLAIKFLNYGVFKVSGSHFGTGHYVVKAKTFLICVHQQRTVALKIYAI